MILRVRHVNRDEWGRALVSPYDSRDERTTAIMNPIRTNCFVAAAALLAASASAQTITTQTLDASRAVGQYNSQAIISGKPAVSYYDSTNGDLKYVRALDTGGTSWAAPITLDDGAGSDVGAYASLAAVDGKPAISYYDKTNGDLKYVRALDAEGVSWSAPVIVHGGLHPAGMYCSLAVVNGRPAISYFDNTTADLRYVRALDTSGTSWGTSVNVDSTGVVGESSSLAVVNGNPAISYYDSTNTNLKYVRATEANGTSWGTRMTVDGATSSVGAHTSLRVVNGNPAISYIDATNSSLKYLRATHVNGSSWGVPVTIEAASGIQGGARLVVVNGNPAVTFCDARTWTGKLVRSTDPNGNAWPAAISVDGAAIHTSMAVVGGNPAVAYYSYPGGNLKWAKILIALPDIAVSQGGNLSDGESTVPFGTVATASSSAPLTFTISNFGEADLTDLATTVNGTHAADFAVSSISSSTVPPGGTATFTVTFSPAAPGARSAAIHISSNVTGPKNPFDIAVTGKGGTTPVATARAETTAEDSPTEPIILTGSDADGDAITYKVVSLPTNGRLTQNGMWVTTVPHAVTGSLVYAAESHFNGADAFTFLASDGVNDSVPATVDITVTPVNDAPSFTGRMIFNVYENTAIDTVVDAVEVTDLEGDDVTWAIEPSVDEPRFAIDADTGVIKVAGPLNFEDISTHELRVTVTDDGSPAESRTETVTVELSDANEAPSIGINTGDVSIVEDSATTPLAFSIYDPDSRPSFSTLDVSATSDNAALVPAANIVLGGDGSSRTISVTPAANRNGSATITLTVSDGYLSSTASFLLLVAAVNDAPTFALPDGLVVATDSGSYSASNFASSILAGPSDEAAQTVSFTCVNDNSALFAIPPAIDANGELTFAPGSSVGTATVTVSAIDSGGTANGGINTSAPRTFTITVNAPAAIFDSFAAEAGLSGEDAAPAAVPHGDGVENLLKYAFNMDAGGPDVRALTPDGNAGLPSVEISTSGSGAATSQAFDGSVAQPVLRLTFLRRKGSGLIYTPQRSSSLSGFVPMTGPQTVTQIDAEWERVSIEEPAAPPGAFTRLKVSLP